MLHLEGIESSRVHVFVTEDDLKEYTSTLNPDWYGKLVVGIKGIVPQREFIREYYPVDTHIISLDDDVESVDLSLSEFVTLDSLFRGAFQRCIEERSYIWSVYPVFNSFFREKAKTVTTGLAFLVGAFYGFINRPGDSSLTTTICRNKEDVERSILYYLKDGKLLRFNKVGFKTKYYGTDGGGLGPFKSRIEIMKQDAVDLHDAYPNLTRIKVRKNSMYEIVVRDRPVPQPIVIEAPKYLDEVLKELTDPILAMISKIRIPLVSGKGGRAPTFGRHRCMTLGYLKARGKTEYALSANSKRYPELYEGIVELGNAICPDGFSSIHVNHNVECPKHKDKGNVGDSVIMSLGDYEGGTLMIEGYGEHNTRNHPLVFDGKALTHWNTPITSGDKYSLVFYHNLKK